MIERVSAKADKNSSAATGKKKDPASSQVSIERQTLEKQLLATLDLEVPFQPSTLLYRVTSIFALLILLIVPLIYLGLLGLLAYTMWWYVQYNAHSPNQNQFLVPTVIVCLSCGLAFIFLVKPIFSFFWGSANGYKPKNLSREAEPFIFEYVDAICEAVNAPKPTLIRLDFNSNASASLKHPILGIFNNELVLTIGMPFISGLTLRQLTGVLAHEFGHFSQQAGMRINNLIFIMNRIMLHVIYVRDRMDDWLWSIATQFDIRLAIPAWICIGVITISRRLLFGVCWFAEMVSAYYSRQMEFDADRYEYRLVGSETFKRTSRRLPELSIANDIAFSRLEMHYSEGRLSDDLPSLIAHESRKLTPEIRKQIFKLIQKRVVGIFDSHPSDDERISKSVASENTGIIKFNPQQDKYPGHVLFRDYKSLCKAATLELYKMNLGKKFDKKTLTPAEEIISRSEEELEARKSLDRYFMTHIPDLRPLHLDETPLKIPPDPKAIFDELVNARQQMVKLLPGYEKYAPCYEAAENSLLQASEALCLLEYDIQFNPAFFNLRKRSKKVAKQRHQLTKSATDLLALKMYNFELAASNRILFALCLLHLPKVREKQGVSREALVQMFSLVKAAIYVSRQVVSLHPTRVFYRRILVLLNHINGNEQRPGLRDSLFEQLDKLEAQLKSLQDELARELYPLDHKRADMTLKEFLLPVVPDWKKEGIGALMGAVDILYNKILTLQIRLFSRLASIAEKVEATLKLAPLEKPGAKPAKNEN